MATFMLAHRHEAAECRIVYAAWRGFQSPLRRSPAMASCAQGGHHIYWTVEARDEQGALAQLPPFVAERTEVSEISAVPIP